MRTFLGVGCGPIQTGIFLLDAAESGAFGRSVVAEIDADLVAAVRAAGGITINVASQTGIETRTIPRVEALNPTIPADRAALVQAAALADELATALPSVAAYPSIAPILAEGFDRAPDRPRLIYAAENVNDAAERLEAAVRRLSTRSHLHTFYLNTVIGKMSRVVAAEELVQANLTPLTPGFARAHLVEAFNDILISDAHGLERGLTQLIEKRDLLPFEEAKLFGHNAIHAAIGSLALDKGLTMMAEAGADRDIMDFAEHAFLDECGAALCRKWQGVDDLFTAEGFAAYAADLLARMTNPHLRDTVARVCRDPERKLGWDDRLIGTMRLCLSQGIQPLRLARIAALAARRLAATSDPAALRARLFALWPSPWAAEQDRILRLIAMVG